MTTPQLYHIDKRYKLIVYSDRVEVVSMWSKDKVNGKLLKLGTNQHGYRVLNCYGKKKFLHRVVANIFFGICPKDKQVNHKDGNKNNNHPSNLEYITAKENIQHAIKLGLHVANDPKRNGRYKDGCTVNRLNAYKLEWYHKNKKRLYGREA